MLHSSLTCLDEHIFRNLEEQIDHARHIRKTVESFQADSDALDAERGAIEEFRKRLSDPEVKATSESYNVIKVEGDEMETDVNVDSKLSQERQPRQFFSEPRESISRFNEDNERYYTKSNEDRVRYAERWRPQGNAEDGAPGTPHGRSGSDDGVTKLERPEVHGDARGDERTTTKWEGVAGTKDSEASKLTRVPSWVMVEPTPETRLQRVERETKSSPRFPPSNSALSRPIPHISRQPYAPSPAGDRELRGSGRQVVPPGWSIQWKPASSDPSSRSPQYSLKRAKSMDNSRDNRSSPSQGRPPPPAPIPVTPTQSNNSIYSSTPESQASDQDGSDSEAETLCPKTMVEGDSLAKRPKSTNLGPLSKVKSGQFGGSLSQMSFSSSEMTLVPTNFLPPPKNPPPFEDFPDHDLDKPVVEDDGWEPEIPPVAAPPPYIRSADMRSRHKKSIRRVAEEHNLRQDRTPQVQSRQIMSGMPSMPDDLDKPEGTFQDSSWASRPNPEEVLNRLEDFFPDHDIDKPVIEESPPAPLPYNSKSADKRSRHKKSIQVVAEEHDNLRQDRSSQMQSSSAANVFRKRSTKLWDSRVEETPGQITLGMPSIPDLPSELVSGTPTPKRPVTSIQALAYAVAHIMPSQPSSNGFGVSSFGKAISVASTWG